MNACLKTYLIKWLFRQKAIQIENRPDSYPDNYLFIYPNKSLNSYPAANKPQKSIREAPVVSKSFIGGCWRDTG